MSQPYSPPEIIDLTTMSPYLGYTYAYPHKLAYRQLDPPVDLKTIWKDEARHALSLYVHIPFCEHRCGFCNLFTVSQPEEDLPTRYLQQLQIQAEQVADVLSPSSFSRLAIGGGTPTYLEPDELTTLFGILSKYMQLPFADIPSSCEVSPATATTPRLEILKQYHFNRISIGVQSFDEREAKQMGRPQRPAAVHQALDKIRDLAFPCLNIDLIYGGDQQTPDSFINSIDAALTYQPEEIYLYPLYVRPLTGLGKTQRSWDDHRLACYRAGRDRLLSQGYDQVSMRMFRRSTVPQLNGPEYCCQTDGMVGLGCGARSYTSSLHYCTEFAVSQSEVIAVLRDYLRQPVDSFRMAAHGFFMNDEESRRRYLLQSLLQTSGLSQESYQQRFETSVMSDFPELEELLNLGWISNDISQLQLTADGIERSDMIGPWLYSNSVKGLMQHATCH